jgi:hypothetical protein
MTLLALLLSVFLVILSVFLVILSVSEGSVLYI